MVLYILGNELSSDLHVYGIYDTASGASAHMPPTRWQTSLAQSYILDEHRKQYIK